MSSNPSGWATPKKNWSSADVVSPTDLNRVEGNIDALDNGARTLDPAQAPTGNTGTLRQFLDWFANRLKTITGTTNWYDTPPTTLQAAKTHMDAAAPHSGHETPSGAQAKIDRAIPRGIIVMWSGSIDQIPQGWALCDGTNGTPDLRDRFIVGAGSSYSVGAKGGAASITLTVDQIPSHSHSTDSAGSHSHSGSTNTTGEHNHTMFNTSEPSQGGSATVTASNYTARKSFHGGMLESYAMQGTSTSPTLGRTSTSGNHSHSLSINSGGSHSHTISSTGGGSSHENRPPYYALCFIMKL